MRLGRIGPPGRERPVVLDPDRGVLVEVGEHVRDIDGDFLAGGGVQRLAAVLAEAGDSLPTTPVGAERIGPPVARPSAVVCIGLNYADHAAESGAAAPDEPVMFLKATNTVVGPDDDVLIPVGGEKTDWEVELAVVLGRTARYLPDPAAAAACIAGYTMSNDVSERAFQLERGGQWDKGKCCETFNPLGPWLVTAQEVPDPGRLGLRLSVNGEPRQHGNTADMIFDVPYLVWYLSQFLVLEPGNVVNTGTPAGVGLGMRPPRYLRPGDLMELEIDGLGRQRQRCRPAQPGCSAR
ncbi:MAG TPA: fumarylacetoacetate hydrolase family protein [Mycobacteriales bacterium]|nr:fumarylacetoacetate hydrolase family protein [Mycobacteriales bacterium]